MTSQPCLVAYLGRRQEARECTPRTRCEQAHITVGGTGYKAGKEKTVPLCHLHHYELSRSREAFEHKYGVDLDVEAARYDAEFEALPKLPW